jgi:hypothetical protein
MDQASGITLHAKLPFSWQSALISSEALIKLRSSNLEVMHALATLESVPDKDHEADPTTSKAIDRIEAKLDIVIGLLSRLASQHAQPPAPLWVDLGVHDIHWQGDDAPPIPGSLILIDLFLSERLPEPLRLLAKVSASDTGHCHAEFLDMDEEVAEWMTRTLFRYHRRELQARHQNQA